MHPVIKTIFDLNNLFSLAEKKSIHRTKRKTVIININMTN